MSNSAERILEGLDAYERGSYEAAAAAFQDALTLQPDAPDALINLGNVHFKQQHYAEARKAWLRATEVDPLNPTPYANLGNLYYAQSQPMLAVGQWEIAISLYPEEQSAILFNLGLAYEGLRKPSLSYDYYSRYLACRGNGDAGMQLKRRLAEAYKLAKHNLQKAEIAMRRGKLEIAYNGFSHSLTIVPFPVKYYQHYGTVLYRLERYKEALFWFEAANTAEIHELNVLVNLGILYEKFSDPLQALWAYQLAIKLYPSNTPKQIQDRYTILWHEQGKACLANGPQRVEADIAAGHYSKADRLAHRLFDLTYRQMPDDLPAVQSLLDRLEEIRHPALRVGREHYRSGQAYDQAGQHAEALADFEHYMRLAPDDEGNGEARTRCAELRSLIHTALPVA